MVIYVFSYNSKVLKIGQLFKKSGHRYRYQHYNPNSFNSNLASSLLNGPKYGDIISEGDVGEWIKLNTDRINFLISVLKGKSLLTLFESYLHCKFASRFEGFSSQ